MLIPILVLLAAYFINIFYVSVLYHRGLTHGAIQLSPFMKWLTVESGSWITGIDPKAWICMHRMHHEFSDTPKDPHSPLNHGIRGTLRAQVRNYERTLAGLTLNHPKYTQYVKDIDFGISWVNRKQLWYLPYLVHFITAVILGFSFQSPLLGAAYYIGIMSHPVQGWMVNSFAHYYGYQNFETGDHSKNNLIVAALVFGEGLQNNHHHTPRSANFSTRWYEPDLGYLFCKLGRRLGLFTNIHLS